MDVFLLKRSVSEMNKAAFIRSRFVSAVILCVVGIPAVGCQLTSRQAEIITPPYPKQAAEVLTIIPLGTDRDEAVKKLKEAGVEGAFSQVSQSVFYCDTWQRENGERWWMNVALLFDESGKLKSTRNPEILDTDMEITSPTPSSSTR